MNAVRQSKKVDNETAAAFSHSGQDDMNYATESKDIHFEHLSDFLLVAFPNSGEVTNARVVDQHIDATEMFFSGSNCFFSL